MLYALYPHKKTDILSIDWTSENYDLLDSEGWLDTQSVQLKFNLKAGKTPRRAQPLRHHFPFGLFKGFNDAE